MLNAFSRKAEGWALQQHLDASLALAALDQAREGYYSIGSAHLSRPKFFNVSDLQALI
jgi:transposase InsO family protein